MYNKKALLLQPTADAETLLIIRIQDAILSDKIPLVAWNLLEIFPAIKSYRQKLDNPVNLPEFPALKMIESWQPIILRSTSHVRKNWESGGTDVTLVDIIVIRF